MSISRYLCLKRFFFLIYKLFSNTNHVLILQILCPCFFQLQILTYLDCSGGGFNRFEKCIVNLEFSDSIYHTIECGLVWQSYDTTSLIIKKK